MELPHVTEDQPFGPDTLAFRRNGKIFALTNLEWVPPAVNLKCDPEISAEYRDRFRGVQPGYHMNKKHWNTVTLDADVPDSVIRALILHSFELVETSGGKEKRIRHGQ
jgi:predicted DNA-binding protein (MmcQ/YjbR family)